MDIGEHLRHVQKVVNRISDDVIAVEGIRLTREEFSDLYRKYGTVKAVAQALRIKVISLNKVLLSKKHRDFYRALQAELRPVRRANRNRRYQARLKARREGRADDPAMLKPSAPLPPPRHSHTAPPVKGNAPRRTGVDALRQALTDLDG